LLAQAFGESAPWLGHRNLRHPREYLRVKPFEGKQARHVAVEAAYRRSKPTSRSKWWSLTAPLKVSFSLITMFLLNLRIRIGFGDPEVLDWMPLDLKRHQVPALSSER